jgi:hypothetical protein
MLLLSDAPLLNLTQLVISKILTIRQGKLDSPINDLQTAVDAVLAADLAVRGAEAPMAQTVA